MSLKGCNNEYARTQRLRPAFD